MVENTETAEIESKEEKRRKRLERLKNYDSTPEAAETKRKFSPEPPETVEVRVEEKLPQDRPKVEKVEIKSGTKTRAPSKEEIGTVAPLLLNSLNTLVVVNFGNDAGMTSNEAAVIAPSLQRCLERLPASTAKRAGVFLDPLVLLIGISLWGKRIIELQDKKAKEKYQVQPTETARANGYSGYEHKVEPPVYQYVPTEPAPVSPPYSTANGVPDAIRNAESDY
jgi:hypothetical protein